LPKSGLEYSGVVDENLTGTDRFLEIMKAPMASEKRYPTRRRPRISFFPLWEAL